MSLDLISTETTQLEDPRQEWRAIQEAMLRDYMQTAHDVLEVSTYRKQLIINFSLKLLFVKAELIR